jgi:2-keto-3-deoxy-L-rhamnonate aldolase RhmA
MPRMGRRPRTVQRDSSQHQRPDAFTKAPVEIAISAHEDRQAVTIPVTILACPGVQRVVIGEADFTIVNGRIAAHRQHVTMSA